MAEETATATASADATETAASEPQSTQSEPTKAQSLAAAEAALAGKGSAAVSQAYDKPKTKPEPEPEPEPESDELDESEPEPEAPPALTLSEADRQILSRLQIDEQDLPADPERRGRFLATLAQRVRDQDVLGSKLANLEKKLKAQPEAEPAAEVDYWKPFNDALPGIFGQEDAPKFAQGIRGAIDGQQKAYHAAMVEPIQKDLQEALSLIYAMHVEGGFADAKAPEGVDLANPVNRKAVLAEARAEVERRMGTEGFKLAEFNIRHAIPWAVQKLYQNKINEARANAEKQRLAKAKRGTPDKGAHAAPGKAAATQEERQLAAARAALAGKGAEGVRAAYDGEIAA